MFVRFKITTLVSIMVFALTPSVPMAGGWVRVRVVPIHKPGVAWGAHIPLNNRILTEHVYPEGVDYLDMQLVQRKTRNRQTARCDTLPVHRSPTGEIYAYGHPSCFSTQRTLTSPLGANPDAHLQLYEGRGGQEFFKRMELR
jgi:hypothetical protein